MLRELYWVGQNRQVGLNLTGRIEVYRSFTLLSETTFVATPSFCGKSHSNASFLHPVDKVRTTRAFGRENGLILLSGKSLTSRLELNRESNRGSSPWILNFRFSVRPIKISRW